MKNFCTTGSRLIENALIVGLALVCASAVAQQPAKEKTVGVEATGQRADASDSAFVVFGQWIQQIAQPWPSSRVESALQTTPFLVGAAVQPAPYEPHPVIVGQPELPLLGQTAGQAARQWNAGLNYQGLQLSYIVVDGRGEKREIRPASRGPLPGERFRIRYTASFDAIAVINKAIGTDWNWRQVGQAWPQEGSGVQSEAGETVELPLDPGTYFVMGRNPGERLVLQVRHPDAKDQARGTQPNYRQDGTRSSQYLQLVAPSTFPYFEQALVGAAIAR